MAKQFIEILENQTIVVSGKTTIVNTGSSNVFFTDNDTINALSQLPYLTQVAVKGSLYSIAPNEFKSLASGTYNIEFAFGGSLVVMKELPATAQ